MNAIQQKIVELFEKNNGNLPSFREIAKEVGVASTNTVSYHIEQLRKKGYLDMAQSPQGIVTLSLKAVCGLEGKPGVYVALHNEKPFFIGSTTNLKKHILESIIGLDTCPFPDMVEHTTIAFHIVPEEHDRDDLERHLREFYRGKGIVI